MADKTNIVNMALMLIGEEKINNLSLSGGSKSEILANTVFDQCANEIFALPYDWYPFKTRAELAEISTTPAFGTYSYQYSMPDNFVRAICTCDECGDDIVYPYRREVLVTTVNDQQRSEQVLLTNETEVYLKYIVRIDDIGQWPAWFNRMVYTNIAYVLSNPLKQKEELTINMFTLREQAIKEGVRANQDQDMNVDANNIDTDLGNTDVSDAATTPYSQRLRRFQAR